MKRLQPRLWFAIAGAALLGALIFGFATGFFNARVDIAPPKSGSLTDAVKVIAFQQNLYVKSDGSLRLGGRPTTLERLEPDLARAFAQVRAPSDRSEQPVTIWADDGAPRTSIDTAYEKLVASGWTATDLSMKTQQIQ